MDPSRVTKQGEPYMRTVRVFLLGALCWGAVAVGAADVSATAGGMQVASCSDSPPVVGVSPAQGCTGGAPG